MEQYMENPLDFYKTKARWWLRLCKNQDEEMSRDLALAVEFQLFALRIYSYTSFVIKYNFFF